MRFAYCVLLGGPRPLPGLLRLSHGIAVACSIFWVIKVLPVSANFLKSLLVVKLYENESH